MDDIRYVMLLLSRGARCAGRRVETARVVAGVVELRAVNTSPVPRLPEAFTTPLAAALGPPAPLGSVPEPTCYLRRVLI